LQGVSSQKSENFVLPAMDIAHVILSVLSICVDVCNLSVISVCDSSASDVCL